MDYGCRHRDQKIQKKKKGFQPYDFRRSQLSNSWHATQTSLAAFPSHISPNESAIRVFIIYGYLKTTKP